MRLFRIAMLCLVCLAGGTIVSYGVAWWAMYCHENELAFLSTFEDLEPPGAWPMPAPQGWPSIAELREMQAESPGLRPHANGWHSRTIEIRYTFATDPHSTIFCMVETRAGWPAATASRFTHQVRKFAGSSLAGEDEPSAWFAGLNVVDRPVHGVAQIGATALKTPIHFPLRPVWPGLLINSACYGSALLALALGSRCVIRARRRRRGLCLKCRYPIGSSPVCTECGTPVAHEPRASASGTL